MEPEHSKVNNDHEQLVVNYDHAPEKPPLFTTPEIGGEQHAERFEQRSEALSVASSVTPVLPTPLTVAEPVTPVSNTPVVADDTPMVAADDDLIEKEWVDKAKKIILQTKDDPYRREQEVNRLQADYLRKRYGRELGASQ